MGKTDKKLLQTRIAAQVAATIGGTAMTTRRIGLIVPSSNVTVETEIPALLARHEGARFSFHASRMRMAQVSPEELRAMNAQRERCVDELADAHVDALLYACLVAVMAQGPGEHRRTEDAVTAQLTGTGRAGGAVQRGRAGRRPVGPRARPGSPWSRPTCVRWPSRWSGTWRRRASR